MSVVNEVNDYMDGLKKQGLLTNNMSKICSSIFDVDVERQAVRKYVYLNKAVSRNMFLKEINAKLDEQEWVTPKHRARVYSSRVAEYDRGVQ